MLSNLSEWLRARLDETGEEPAYRRLARLLQQAILSGRLASGVRLPSSRALAAELGIARNTVTHVYEQLAAEGYVQSHSGSGTYVADTSLERLRAEPRTGRRPLRDHQRLSKRGRRTIEMAGVSKLQWGAFMPGVPDVTEFPLKVWNRLHNRVWRQIRPELMTYAQGGGYRPLRRVLADYLRVARAASCEPDQVVITTGIHQSVDLAVRLLCDVGDEVWVEDPCYWGVRNLLISSGLKAIPIPVDEEGMNPSPRHLARPPRLIVCTPSHQYPLGCVMSLTRRRMLLDYAAANDCWIIEDDYDSEFRYGIHPLASLQGLDPHGQVIYVGSFSKVLFPGLRVGYMVVPTSMADFFAQGIAELYREGQMMQQAVLAEFIDEGYLGSHIRRMRGLYAERRGLLIDAVHRHYGDALPVFGGEAGLHMVLGLPQVRDDLAVSQAALAQGILTRALSGYYNSVRTMHTGLILGYACVPSERIDPAFEVLAQTMDRFMPSAA
ncbi:PLP-dependent aminotransferase family protein [Corticibacter populi]|uniref:PLP-dependent aminotransferase family protein n=1 Tax=Corticibacter populi TaxID=1550736 RepID=A0A3M6QPE5_9BURK|nr:PLP-dependent aminotransferase family protein [Corticibacter populi]RMX04943.1 PLP-dependent aminotransferase family protein [Corticibacter populi]RZS33631.1 GntR family transcriptional regulator [Corticibacter populi]